MTREEAKKIFLNRGSIDGVFDGNKWRDACLVISKWLEQEPRKGHWILGGYDEYYYICDRCKFVASEYYAKPNFHYCPNCGAKMEVEE